MLPPYVNVFPSKFTSDIFHARVATLPPSPYIATLLNAFLWGLILPLDYYSFMWLYKIHLTSATSGPPHNLFRFVEFHNYDYCVTFSPYSYSKASVDLVGQGPLSVPIHNATFTTRQKFGAPLLLLYNYLHIYLFVRALLEVTVWPSLGGT